jgi:hypothetical protein
MKLYYKEKTPHSLNALLLASEYFRDNWKLIPRIVSVINQINNWSQLESSPSITFQFFKNRLGNAYSYVLSELESLDLLQIRKTFRRKYSNGRYDKGKCYSYSITGKCCNALADTNREYLYLLLTDNKECKNNKERIRKRKYNKLQYGDTRDELKHTIDGITFDLESIDKISKTYTTEKRAFVYSLLIDIVEKNYKELKYNEKDNRVWTPYTQLPAAIKTQIKIHGKEYICSTDIRSCYPSLFATYIKETSTQLDHSLNSEIEKWNNIFLNRAIDPKDFLSNALGIKRDKIKEVQITYFNGRGFRNNKFSGSKFPKSYSKFNTWLETEFPLLYSNWIKTNVSQTGNNIGKLLETKLMLDGSIYRKAKELNLILGYEYDGFSLYGNVCKDHESITELLEFIELRSMDLLGIKLVFTSKDIETDIFQLQIAGHKESMQALAEKWKKTCRIAFSNKVNTDWNKFREQQSEYYSNIRSHIELIEGLQTIYY